MLLSIHDAAKKGDVVAVTVHLRQHHHQPHEEGNHSLPAIINQGRDKDGRSPLEYTK